MRTAIIFCLIFSFWSSAWAETYIVRFDKTDVRHGPGREFPAAWQVNKGYVYEKTGEKGKWIQVKDIDGDGGWVHESHVRKSPVVIVTGEVVNIRDKPGTDSNVISRAAKGLVLNYLDREGEWLKISRPEFGVGWIHKDLVWGNP